MSSSDLPKLCNELTKIRHVFRKYYLKFSFVIASASAIKAIIEKSRGEVSLMEQETIENVS